MRKTAERKLRTGFTTGAAAAAAAKGALLRLLGGVVPESVPIRFLTREETRISIHRCEKADESTAICSVIKDAGDDPDVTNGAEIGAAVMLLPDNADGEIEILGGKGVGRVTRPGLEVPPGGPAINSGPRKMIMNEIRSVLDEYGRNDAVRVTVFVPNGEVLAQKTLNARLGILGGISILGTTGIVRPLSHEAYLATIEAALSVAVASGCGEVVFTTGRRSERFAVSRWPGIAEPCFIQIGDYFQAALAAADRRGIDTITIAVFFGKALKMAEGIAHTHAQKSALSLRALAELTADLPGGRALSESISRANTAREVFGLLSSDHVQVIRSVAQRIVTAASRFAPHIRRFRAVIFDYDGNAAAEVVKEFNMGREDNA